jgi:outer membrane protein assembly factor BamD (BamD/ComL family)
MLELAWVRYGQRDYQAARTQIDELLRLEANPESAIHASAHYLRGLTLDADGQSFAALTDWGVLVDDALDRHPDATDARRRIIGVATKLGVDSQQSSRRPVRNRPLCPGPRRC